MHKMKITSDMMAVYVGMNTPPSHVELTDEEYNSICEKYGHTWQFVNQHSINYFKNQEWGRAKVK